MKDECIKVSVILPVYRDIEGLAATLRTVSRQTLQGIEIIVIDDGNSEMDRKAIEQAVKADSRIRLLTNDRNLGLSKSLVHGCAVARAPYIARIDNMDLMVPADRLECQHSAMERDTNLVLIGGNLELVDCINLERFRTAFAVAPADRPLEVMKREPCFHHPTVMFRKSTYEDVGGYNGALNTEEDFDLWRRMLRLGDGVVMQEVFAIATMRPASISVRRNNTQIAMKIMRIMDEEKPASGLAATAKAARRIFFELPKFLIPKRYRLKLRHRRWGKYLGRIDRADAKSLESLFDFYERAGYFRQLVPRCTEDVKKQVEAQPRHRASDG